VDGTVWSWGYNACILLESNLQNLRSLIFTLEHKRKKTTLYKEEDSAMSRLHVQRELQSLIIVTRECMSLTVVSMPLSAELTETR
jgi:hypothetical protein